MWEGPIEEWAQQKNGIVTNAIVIVVGLVMFGTSSLLCYPLL